MKTLVITLFTAILLTCVPLSANARVIAGDLSENTVAIYYFNDQIDGYVRDHGTDTFTGALLEGAEIRQRSGRKSLELTRHLSMFAAWNENTPIHIQKEFSIVAWVLTSPQRDDFTISLLPYNGPILDPWDHPPFVSQGSVYMTIRFNGELRGGYEFNNRQNSVSLYRGGLNIGNLRWNHIGFVINNNIMKLYFNGRLVTDKRVGRHLPFSGSGAFIHVGDEEVFVNVDDIGLFRNDLSDSQIRLIYEVGLENIISIAAVDPNAKVATTWGALKHQ